VENNENNKPNYSKILDEELNSAPAPTTSAPSPISTPSPRKKTFLLPIIVAISFFLIAGVITIIVVLSTPTPTPAVVEENPQDNKNEEEDAPVSTFTFEMPKLDTEIELPESLKGKIFSYTDGESYFIWGYTGDEKPEYVDENSPNFFPLFAMNYSPDPLKTEKYSFDSGSGAHGREDDGRILYFHTITEVNGSKIEIENLEFSDQLIEDYEAFELYFRDGFKYRDL